MSESYVDKLNFIRKFAGGIKPVVSEPNLVDAVTEGKDIGEESAEKILRESETRVFLYEKKSAAPDAKSFLLEASEPLAYMTIGPIVERLKADPRCKSFCLLADNYAGKEIQKRGDADLVEAKDNKLLMAEIPGDFDVGIFLVEPKNSPNSLVINSGKTVFGAKKLYGVVSGWSGVGSESDIFKDGVNNKQNDVDGILCNDDLAKTILEHQLPEFPKDKITIVGSPVIDALDRHKAKELCQNGREALGISPDDYVFLYLGDISDYHNSGFDCDDHINEKTFDNFSSAAIATAESNPEQNFVLLVRPHPRDPNQEQLKKISQRTVPKNLQIKWADRGVIGIQEATYAADFISSIMSTENILARLRGKKSVFLGYDNRLGKAVLEQVYGQELLGIIDSQPGLKVAFSQDQVVEYIKVCLEDKNKDSFVNLPTNQEDSVGKMLEILFKD